MARCLGVSPVRRRAVDGHASVAVVLGAEHLADVALAVADYLPEPPGQFHRLVPGARLDQREADDHLLGLGERPVSQRDVPA